MGRVLAIGGLLAVAVSGCTATQVRDYDAAPVDGREGQEGRLVAEVEGVRVQVGPPAVFPYEEESGRRTRAVGRYQLYTRIMVESVGADSVTVEWSGVRLVEPSGDTIGLVTPGARAEQRGGQPAPAQAEERIGPGGMATRSLIPATFERIGVNEPLVTLCDGCAYRLVVPVIVGARRVEVGVDFRLIAAGRRERSVRFLFWQ